MHEQKIRSVLIFTHSSDLTFNIHEFSDPADIVLDSATTSPPVTTFATSCKSRGGAELEEGRSFKAKSISHRSAIMNEIERKPNYCGALY
jgi:hypothetical protein